MQNLPPPRCSPIRDDGKPHLKPGFIHAAATNNRKLGLSFIPIADDGSKFPAFPLLPRVTDPEAEESKATWKVFTTRRPTRRDIDFWYRQSSTWYSAGIAILGGAISGGLEIIDFDSYEIYRRWETLMMEQWPKLLASIVWVQSPRPGRHGYYQCEAAGGNQKLAQVAVADPETGKPKAKTLIELKGEGGYCIAPPSPAACHPTGRRYRFVTGKDFAAIPTITPSQRDCILSTARSFNTYAPPRKTPPPILPRNAQSFGACQRPGDAFEASASWAEILEPHGWSYEGESWDGVQKWTRPGKSRGSSATVNYGGNYRLHVFSSNASPLEPETTYSKFHAYTVLNHEGDFHAAARELRAQGYGGHPDLSLLPPSIGDKYSSLDLPPLW